MSPRKKVWIELPALAVLVALSRTALYGRCPQVQGGTKWPAVAAPLPGNFSEKALLAGNFSEKTILTGNFSEQTILAGSFIEPGNFGNFGLTIQEIFEESS